MLKLFNMVGADIAYFGQKDYQQTLVVRQMVRDFNVPITVEVCPTVREPDGLAMSSRNVYLSPDPMNHAWVRGIPGKFDALAPSRRDRLTALAAKLVLELRAMTEPPPWTVSTAWRSSSPLARFVR